MANEQEAELEVTPSESQSAKLTDWEKEPSLMDLKSDFTDAQASHNEHIANVETWLNNLNVTGSADPKSNKKAVKNRSTIQPKVIRKQAEWRYAALSEPFLSTSDIFNTSPESAEDKDSAVQNGLMLNHQFNNRIDKVEFMDTLVRTLVDEGTAIVRVGWEYAQEEITVEVPVFEYLPDANAIQLHSDLAEMKEVDPTLYSTQSEELQKAHDLFEETGIPYKPRRTSEFEEITETKVTKNQPTVEVCDYRNVHLDPTCRGDMDKANFVIYSFQTSLSELKKDGDRYRNLENININNSSILGNPDHHSEDGSDFNFKDQERKKFVAYEYWGYYDIDGTGIAQPFVATWVGNTLIRMERNPFPDQKLPFVVIQYLPVRKSNYGEPDGKLLEDNQKVIGAVTRGMMDTMARSANGQAGTRKDALDVVNRRKFERGEDYEYNPGMTPNDVIFMHQFPEIPQSAQFMLGMNHSEAESLTGIKAFNNGITGEALGDSTGLGKSALDAASKREMGILRRVSQGMMKIGLKIIAMNAVFLSEEESVRITGEKFVIIRRDQLEGNFDLKLTISTPEADAAKAEELAFMLQTMDNTTPPELRNMLLSEIATLRNMPELAKKLREFVPEVDPIAQEKAQLENDLMKAEIAKLYAEAEVKRAEAGKKVLDHVEQEEGVTHARDLEKGEIQAKSNLQRDIVNTTIKGQQDIQKEQLKQKPE
jgi:hypothetical protein